MPHARPAPDSQARHRKHASHVRAVDCLAGLVFFADGAVRPVDVWMREGAR